MIIKKNDFTDELDAEEERYFNGVEDDDDLIEDMDPPEGTEFGDEEDEFLTDDDSESDEDSLIDDNFLVDGESTEEADQEDDTENRLFDEAEDDSFDDEN